MTEVPAVDPGQFAEMVRNASDADLEAGLRANHELILGQVFERMPEFFEPSRAGDVEAVSEWRIDIPGADEPERWQVAIAGGGAQVTRGGDQQPTVVYALGGLDFLKLITGAVEGPQLFITGKLRIEGDLMLAARMPSMFRFAGN